VRYKGVTNFKKFDNAQIFFCLFHSMSTLFIRFSVLNQLKASAILKRTVVFVHGCMIIPALHSVKAPEDVLAEKSSQDLTAS
jgi:hypothetical protein